MHSETTSCDQNPLPPIVRKGELPDPFALLGGGRVSSRDAWPERAKAWREMIVGMAYGGMPPPPASIEVETLCHAWANAVSSDVNYWTYRIYCHRGERPFAFCAKLIFPATASGPLPVVVNKKKRVWPLNAGA